MSEYYLTTWRELINDVLEVIKEEIIFNTLTEEELDRKIDCGYSGDGELDFTAWTENYVIFPVIYDGAVWAGYVPRNPCDQRHDIITHWMPLPELPNEEKHTMNFQEAYKYYLKGRKIRRSSWPDWISFYNEYKNYMGIRPEDAAADDWEVEEKEEELKPCPFCGNEPKIWLNHGYHFIYCLGCSVRTVNCSKKEHATEAWNRRVNE